MNIIDFLRVSGLDVLQRVRHDVRLHHLTGVYSHHLRHVVVLLLHLTPPTGQQGGVPTNQLYNLQQYQPAVQPATIPTSCTTCNNTLHITPPTGHQVLVPTNQHSSLYCRLYIHPATQHIPFFYRFSTTYLTPVEELVSFPPHSCRRAG